MAERMVRIHGQLRVERVSPQGTRVVAEWSGAVVGHASPDVSAAPLRAYGGGFLRMFVLVAAVFHATALYYTLHLPFDYRIPVLTLACWTVMLLAGLLLALGVRWRWMGPWPPRLAVAVTVGSAVTVAANCQPWGVLGPANWPIGDCGWILVLLAAYRPVWEAMTALAGVAVANIVIVGPLALSDPAKLAKLVGVLLGVGLLQLGAAVAFHFVNTATRTTAENVWRANELVSRQMHADEARATRGRRYEQIDRGVIDLLRDIADERLDPTRSDVRRRCLAASNALGRRVLGPLADEAARHDVEIDITAVDDLVRVPPDRRQLMIEALTAALPYARPGRALITAHEGSDLIATPSSTDRDAFSLTLHLPIGLGNGSALVAAVRVAVPADIHDVKLDIALSDENDDEVNDAKATRVWIAVVYRP
jgi:hypothetical protein